MNRSTRYTLGRVGINSGVEEADHDRHILNKRLYHNSWIESECKCAPDLYRKNPEVVRGKPNLQWCLLLAIQNGVLHLMHEGARWSGTHRIGGPTGAWKHIGNRGMDVT